MGTKFMIPQGVLQFLTFGVVGAVGTLAHYGVLWLTTDRLGWSPILASGAGYLVGSVVNYLLNYRFTFASGKSHLDAAGRFYIVVGTGWFINNGMMALLTVVLGWTVWPSQLLTTAVGLAWNFSGSKMWAFDEGAGISGGCTVGRERS